MARSAAVFLSHASEDLAEAQELCGLLEECGYSCFLDRRDIAPGSDWAGAIAGSISGARVFVLLLSRFSNVSEEVAREVSLARMEKRPILVVRLANLNPSKELAYHVAIGQWVEAFPGGIAQRQEQIAAAVGGFVDAGKRPAIPWTRRIHAWLAPWRTGTRWAKYALLGFLIIVVVSIAVQLSTMENQPEAALGGLGLQPGMTAPAGTAEPPPQRIAALQSMEQARALLFQGQPERAMGLLKGALPLISDVAEPHVLMCFASLAQRDPESAARYASQAIQLDSRHYGAWMCRGEADIALGRFADAYRDCNQSLSLRVAQARQLVCRGTALQYLGRPYEAAADLQAAQQLPQ